VGQADAVGDCTPLCDLLGSAEIYGDGKMDLIVGSLLDLSPLRNLPYVPTAAFVSESAKARC
jgi:hypothetical protein